MESCKYTQILRAFQGDGVRYASSVCSTVIFKYVFKRKHTWDLESFITEHVGFPVGKCPNLYTLCRLLVMVLILMQLSKYTPSQTGLGHTYLQSFSCHSELE